jgi:hypothetical protein
MNQAFDEPLVDEPAFDEPSVNKKSVDESPSYQTDDACYKWSQSNDLQLLRLVYVFFKKRKTFFGGIKLFFAACFYNATSLVRFENKKYFLPLTKTF